MTKDTTTEERQEHLQQLARELKTIVPDITYFAATLLGDDDGWRLSWQTTFAGWPDGGGPDKGVELREAAPIITENMIAIWDDAGEPWIAATNPAHLAWFLRLGGHALIAEDIARKHFRSSVEPREVVANGAVGFIHYDPGSRNVTHHAPTRKQRMRVLKRDGYRCQLCGERPSDNPHIVLHVHHVRPFARGGLTIDENLITLCHTCHDGLEPHDDLALFWLPGGHVDWALAKETKAAFEDGVAAYRRNVAPTFAALASADS
jgi:hypothetical protein